MKVFAIIIFIIMYLIMISFQKLRVYAALVSAILFMIVGVIRPAEAFASVNWNILMMIAGTMVVVHYFIGSRMPNRLADLLLGKSKNLMWVIIYMSLFSGLISAFIDNVATVLMVAPVGLAICRKLDVSPVPMILSIAVSSNLQGAATLVGDTTSMMLAAYAKMDFMSFFWFHGRPGIFFAVEIGAVITVPVMMILFSKMRQPVEAGEPAEVKDKLPSVLLILVVVTLIAASFIPTKPEMTNGFICMAYAVAAVILDLVRYGDSDRVLDAVKSIDYETLLLLTGLFIVIAGITEVGLIEDIAGWIVRVGGSNLFLLYTIIVWGSVLVSAFVDNIPYVATMLPVLQSVTMAMGIEPYLLYFGLLTGATLGGNLTPIGASANITAVGMLRRNGHPIAFVDFMKIGVPFTLTAVTCGYLYTWFVWR
ncbi:MAG: TRAP transporter large permease subunit [Mogibacterium sp.]|nr:TRAP transporter large permease subunit [Mogibacterium sp.]